MKRTKGENEPPLWECREDYHTWQRFPEELADTLRAIEEDVADGYGLAEILERNRILSPASTLACHFLEGRIQAGASDLRAVADLRSFTELLQTVSAPAGRRHDLTRGS